MGFPLPISIENIFLFLTLYQSPKKCRRSHHEQMCRCRPGLVCRQRAGGGHPWDSPPAAFPSPPQMLAANSSSAVCQTAMGPGGGQPGCHPLPLPLLTPCPVLPAWKARLSLCWSPRLFWSLDSGPCRRGMTPNQHCQHFASSLGQGRAHPSASPPPRSDPTLGHSGTGSLGSQRRSGQLWHTDCPSRSVPALLLRGGRPAGEAHGRLPLRSQSHASTQLCWAGPGGRCWRLGHLIETPSPSEGELAL